MGRLYVCTPTPVFGELFSTIDYRKTGFLL